MRDRHRSTAARASSVKLRPRIAASCSRTRSSGPSASSREAISACSVSGTWISPRSPTSSKEPSPGRSTPRSASIRIISTAYSGMPSARSTIRVTATSSAPGTIPRTSSAIVASGSGSRCIARKLRWPEPQFGRRSRSSGRARVTMKIGLFRDHSSIDSMNSSRPASAHCRSSNTIATVPPSLMRSKKVRQAANSSSRPPAGRSSSPSRNASRGSSQWRSSSSGTCSATDAASFDRDTPGGVGLRDPGTHPDHLAERPERDAVAVGGASPVVPPDRLREAVDVLEELPGQARLADPAHAHHRDHARLPLAAGRVQHVLQLTELLGAAHERRLDPDSGCGPGARRPRGGRAMRGPTPPCPSA